MPVLRVLQRLAGVAGDRHFFRIAARGRSEMPSHAFDPALEDVVHRVIRPHVAVIEVAPHRLVHGARRRTDVAVVEVEHVAVDGERVADFGPEVLVPGDVLRSASHDRAGGGAHALDRIVLKRGRGGGHLEEIPSIHQVSILQCPTRVKGAALERVQDYWSAHRIASRYIFCTRGSSHVSAACPKVA